MVPLARWPMLLDQWRGGREVGGGGGGAVAPSDNFLGVLKVKGSAKICNCQCELLYKICKIQLVNKFPPPLKCNTRLC